MDVQPDNYDFAHEIHEISFGSKIKKISSKNIRSSFNPLGSRSRLDGNHLESHEYIMRVVPTTYEVSFSFAVHWEGFAHYMFMTIVSY